MGLLKIPFFRLGEWKHPKYGSIKGTDKKFSDFINNFNTNSLGRPPFIRIGHDKGECPTFGGAEALAWVKDIVKEGNVLYAMCEPTSPEVEAMIKSKRYRFASAEYDDNYIEKTSGKNVGSVLSAIALTNEPFLTNLPENVVLSDDSEEFYLDFNESEGKGMDEFMKKLSDFFSAFTMKLREEKPTDPVVTVPAKEDNSKFLAEFEEMKKKLSDIEKNNTNLLSDNEMLKKVQEEKEVDVKLSELKMQGVPPVMCDKAREILLAMPQSSTIKLADNTEKKLSDSVYELLNSIPKEARVNYSQYGTQLSARPGETDVDFVKLAEEDIKALGGKVQDGKFIV